MLGLQRDLQPTQSVVHRHLISLTPNQVANSLVRNSSPRKNKSLNKKDHKIPQANKNTPTHKLMFDEEDITNQKGEGIHQKKNSSGIWKQKHFTSLSHTTHGNKDQMH